MRFLQTIVFIYYRLRFTDIDPCGSVYFLKLYCLTWYDLLRLLIDEHIVHIQDFFSLYF